MPFDFDAMADDAGAIAPVPATPAPTPQAGGFDFDAMASGAQAPMAAPPQPEAIRHYADLPEAQKEFMPEDWGLLDALGVLARPGQAVVSGYEGYKKGEDIGQIAERAKTELLTPHGIEGSKEVIMGLMPGQWQDTTMAQIAEKRGITDPDQAWYETMGQFVSDAYEAADPIDWLALGTDIAVDPLWVAAPAKAVGAVGKVAKPVAGLAKRMAPEPIELAGRVMRENNITLAAERMFAGNDYFLNKIVKRGEATSDDVLRSQDQLAQYHGMSNRVLDEALKMEGKHAGLGLKEVQFKAVAHAMEMGQGRGKFIDNPVAGHVYVGGQEVPITKDMMQVANDVARMKDELHVMMNMSGVNVGHVQNFVHHMFPEKKQSWARKFFLDDYTPMDSRPGGVGGLGKASFEYARKEGSTLKSLQKAGLQPEEDIRKIATKYFLEVHHTLASRNLMDFARKDWGIPITGIKDVERIARKKDMALYTAKGRFIEGTIPQKKAGAMGKVLEDDGTMVLKALEPGDIENYIKEGHEIFALPKEMGEVLNRHFGAFSEAGRTDIGNLFKQYNSWWKSYALLSGGFHIRNGYGGIFQNYISGMLPTYRTAQHYKNSVAAAAAAVGEPAKMQAKLSKIKVPGMKDKTVWDLWQEARNRGWVDTTTMHSEHLGMATRGTARHALTKAGREKLTKADWAKMALPTQEFAPVQLSRGLGNSVENSLRFALYMDRRVKGDNIINAGKAVVRTHFDYRYGLTPFERGIRDNALPFYSWLRFNVPFQLNNLYRQPAKYSVVPKMVHAISGNETAMEERYKPGYFRELGLFKIPNSENEEGFSNYFFPDMPFKDIMTMANLAKPLTAMLAGDEPSVDHLAAVGQEIMQNAGPIPKVLMEQMTDFNFFQKRTIGPGEYEPFPAGMIWLPDAVKSRIGGVERNGVWVMHRNDVNAYETMVPLLGKVDRMFAAQQERTEEHGNAILSILLGWKTYHYNLNEAQRNFMMQEKQQRKEERATERGQQREVRDIQANQPKGYKGMYVPQTPEGQFALRQILEAQKGQ